VSVGNESHIAEGLIERAEIGPNVFCPNCGFNRPRRVERKGLMQKYIYPMFGFFPWHCRECHHQFLLRKRDRPRSRDTQRAEHVG
jgi:DNA-directed RNA polymerase subunit RPC12/RpoP